MKKIIILFCVVFCSAVVIAGCSNGKESDNKKEKNSQEKTVSADELTYDDLYKANNGTELLKKHSSVEYILTTFTGQTDEDGNEEEIAEKWDLFMDDDDYVISRESESGESQVFCNETCYYKDASKDKDNPKYSKGWFMDDIYEKYMDENVNEFLLSKSSQEDFDEIKEKDGKYVILSYYGENEDKDKCYYRYTTDKETLEIEKYEAVMMRTENLKTEEYVVAKAEVKYDKKVELPGFIQEIEKANVNKRKVTLHKLSKDGKPENDIVVELPENTTLIAALDTGYGLYKDEKAEVVFDDTKTEQNAEKMYPDSECYLIYKEGGTE